MTQENMDVMQNTKPIPLEELTSSRTEQIKRLMGLLQEMQINFPTAVDLCFDGIINANLTLHRMNKEFGIEMSDYIRDKCTHLANDIHHIMLHDAPQPAANEPIEGESKIILET